MSTIIGLAEADLRVSSSILLRSQPETLLSYFQTDTATLDAAERIIGALQSKGFRTTAPSREGKRTLGFGCGMTTHDASISVTVDNDEGHWANLHLFIRQVPTDRTLRATRLMDPGWPLLSNALREALFDMFGAEAEITWTEFASFSQPSKPGE